MKTIWARFKIYIIFVLLVIGTCFLLGIFYSYHLPRIRDWAALETEKQTNRHSPVRVWPQSVHINFFPLGLSLENIRILPQKKWSDILKPTTLKKAEIRISIWALLKGEFRIGRISLQDGEFVIYIPKFDAQDNKSTLNVQSLLKNIPVDELEFKNLSLRFIEGESQSEFGFKDVDLFVESQYKAFRAQLNIDQFAYRKKNSPPITLNFSTEFLIDKSGLYFSKLNLTDSDSKLIATGAVLGAVFNGDWTEIRANAQAQVKLHSLQSTLKNFIATKLPRLSGQAQIQLDVIYKRNGELKSQFNLETSRLKFNQYEIGEVKSSGRLENSHLELKNSIVQNLYGHLKIPSFQIDLKNEMKFDLHAQTTQFDLPNFLQTLGLPKIPVITTLQGQVPCQGQFQKPFGITCRPRIQTADFKLMRGLKNDLHIRDVEASGEVKIDSEKVAYQSQLRVGSSKGESSGEINYTNGFKIKFNSPQLLLSEVPNLYSLKPEGTVSVSGFTQGDSHAATVTLNATGENMWLYDYKLGHAQFKLGYRDGVLSITDATGQVGNTQYQAQTIVNVKNDHIKVSVRSVFLDAVDVIEILSRQTKLPFSLTGTGSAAIDLDGPLILNKLSYKLSTSIFRGTLMGETFDLMQLQVQSDEGYATTKKAILTKGRSQIRAEGHMKPDGQINLSALARNFKVEQSENISKYKINATGNLDADMHLTGHIQNPDFRFLGRLTQTTVGDQPAPNSDVECTKKGDRVLLVSRLLGDSLRLKLEHDLDPKGQMNLQFSTHHWDFAQFFTLFSDTSRTKNFETRMTSELNFTIPNENPSALNGEIRVQDFYISQSRIEMRNTQPLLLQVKNGLIQTSNFEIIGSGTYLRLVSAQKTLNELALDIDGRIDLSLATLMTPFLDDLSGISKFSLNITGPWEKPKLAGSTFLENGYIRFKGFPHGLEQSTGDALFSHDRIILNSMKGRIAGGVYSSSGSVTFGSLDKIVVDLRGQFTDAKFNVPEGFSTRGSGEFFMRGDWLPYTLGVNYRVSGGQIESKPQKGQRENNDIKPSAYLPKELTAKRSSPILLDLDVNVANWLPFVFQMNQVKVQTDVIGQVKVNGPPEAPLLTGIIQINKGGKIIIRNNVFEVQNGRVIFDHSRPDNPTLDIDSKSNIPALIGAEESRDYDIDMRVQGTAQNPKITMTSDPPLPETDLISLLTLGFINQASSDNNDKATSSDKITNTSYQIGSAFINEQLGINKVLQERLGVKFDFNSSYSSQDKAAKNKFQFTKQWTPKFGMTASREVGKTSTNNVKAEYKLNKRLSVIGEWEGNENTGAETNNETKSKDKNIFGFDIEYKVDFK